MYLMIQMKTESGNYCMMSVVKSIEIRRETKKRAKEEAKAKKHEFFVSV